MMLNTDMELAFEIDVDANAGTTTCAPVETEQMGACQAAQTASLVQTYAEVIFFWLQQKVFQNSEYTHSKTY